MQFWILSPSVHVLDTRELGFRHISTVWFLLCTSLASDSIRHDSCRLAFSETLLRTSTAQRPPPLLSAQASSRDRTSGVWVPWLRT